MLVKLWVALSLAQQQQAGGWGPSDPEEQQDFFFFLSSFHKYRRVICLQKYSAQSGTALPEAGAGLFTWAELKNPFFSSSGGGGKLKALLPLCRAWEEAEKVKPALLTLLWCSPVLLQ